MDWRFNTIWFDQIEQDKIFQKDFNERDISSENNDFENAEYAILWHLKDPLGSVDHLAISANLLYLELNWANLKNFSGIEKYKHIKRLELHNCVKLENDFGIGVLGHSLEFLHINQSRKFKITDEFLHLKKLKVLCLNACGAIDNLHFLKDFPNLIDFRFVDTDILDGNLNLILEPPTIRTVGFQNKKHYNYKADELERELNNKFKNR